MAVDNRRTMCDHCSLRKDLPGFISEAHAEGNIMAIKSGELFKCHMIHNPTQHNVPNRVCLGAALVGGAELANVPAGGQSAVYDTLDEYKQTQIDGRVSDWYLYQQDKWIDESGERWYGWWSQAPAGNWHYLMATYDSNKCDSVYLFFDQCQDLYGPLKKES
jgi:hypothetical protein